MKNSSISPLPTKCRQGVGDLSTNNHRSIVKFSIVKFSIVKNNIIKSNLIKSNLIKSNHNDNRTDGLDLTGLDMITKSLFLNLMEKGEDND